MLPKAIGPYSLYRVQEGKALIFLSGQLGIDPETGNLEEGIERQTRRAMENVLAILKTLNCSAENIVKSTIYLVNPEDFAIVNEIYASYFNPPYPARTTIFVKTLPKNALVEIEVIAST